MSKFFRLTAMVALACLALAILLVAWLAGPMAGALFAALMLVGLWGPRAAIVLLFVPGFAWADSATSFDVSPFVTQYVLPFVFSLLGLLGLWLLNLLKTRLGLANDAQLSGTLEQAMTNGLAFAQSRLQAKIGAGPLPVDVKSEAVKLAAQYAIDHVPGTMKSLGITPELVAEKIEARLSLNTTPSTQSIAIPTPDVPPPPAV
jgi:hypothetical protein